MKRTGLSEKCSVFEANDWLEDIGGDKILRPQVRQSQCPLPPLVQERIFLWCAFLHTFRFGAICTAV